MHHKTITFIIALLGLVLLFAFFSGDEAPRDLDLPLAVAAPVVALEHGDVYELVADEVVHEIDGKKVAMLAYNGSIPGPTIKVAEGAIVTIRFVNRTSMPTLLHSHGVRMANEFDGTHIVQKDVLPGETFDYVLRFPDPGIFWYHPHVREDIQQNMGLYGSFLVTPKDPTHFLPVDHEEVLFLSDVLMEGGALAPYSEQYVTHALMGRFGNTILVNGKTTHSLQAEPGEVHRFFVANAATVRPFDFRIAGAKMKLVGGDASRYEYETFVDSVVLAPSERAVIEVYFPEQGTHAIEHRTPERTYPLGSVSVSGEPVSPIGPAFGELRTDLRLKKEFDRLRAYLTKKPDKTIRLTLETDMTKIMGLMMGGSTSGHDHGGGMEGMMHAPVPIEWEDDMGDMNTFSTSETTHWIMRDEETGKENMDIIWKFTAGEYYKIRIINDAASMHPMQHPIHFHGNRFAVLAVNDVPNANMVWKDTTLLQTGDTVDIILEAENPGKWLAHCHIAEHMHAGMMMEYDVE